MASSKEIQLGTGSESSGPSNFLLLSIISMPGRQPSDQRHKHPQVEITTKYASGVQVINALRTDNTDALTQVLISLRNQLALKPQDVSITSQDERLVIVREWLKASPGAEVLFEVWDATHPNQCSVIALVLSILSSILTLVSAHYNDHSLGRLIMKTMLTPVKFRYLNSYVSGSRNELIILAFKLYNVMSNFAGGGDKNSVLENFAWETKYLAKVLNMRRKMSVRTDPLIWPDIRTFFILFLLSFLDANATVQTKSAFLERHRDIFLSVFKGIGQDHYSLVKRILEVCWIEIWSDQKLKRTLKVGLFNEITIGHLTKLYDRVQSDDDDDEHVPANIVHHYLLAICTRPGIGICFKDKGWYPRETDLDCVGPREDEDSRKGTGKIHNKILANVLKSLKVNEGSRQQELAIKILSACPELVAGYWAAAALTLEPRLSSKWIANVTFAGKIISLPIPTFSFYLSNQLYNPTPPLLSTVLENILPSANSRNNLSKGLQSPSGLVQHCTALTLIKTLCKFQAVLEKFREIAGALEEDEEDGQWLKRCRELEKEARKKIPEFMVVVAFGHQTQRAPQIQEGLSFPQANKTKNALLTECAQRLLWLYQRCLPGVVAEARFDVGKVLHTFAEDDEKEEVSDAAERLYRVQQLHILRLLRVSNQFAWSVKISTLPHTPLYILLKALTSSRIAAIRTTLNHLVCHILSHSILFQEDPEEPNLWLKALPRYRPAILPYVPRVQQADIIDMSDESINVITFLDECVQRCLQTPYRYVEALRSLALSTASSNGRDLDPLRRVDEFPSPLLMTLLEQLEAKLKNKSLAPACLVGAATFIGTLTFYLSSKTKDLGILKAYADQVDAVLSQDVYARVVNIAVRKTLTILRCSLTFKTCQQLDQMNESEELQIWLSQIESLPITEVESHRKALALRLVDKIRSLDAQLTTSQLKRLFRVISTLDISVLPNLIEYIVPGYANLWQAALGVFGYSVLSHHLTFELLYLHTGLEDLFDDDKQKILVETIFTHPPTLAELGHVLSFIMHGIALSSGNSVALNAHIVLLARFFETIKAFNETYFEALKEIVFIHPNSFKDVLFSAISGDVLEATKKFLNTCANPLSASDRKLLFEFSYHWFHFLSSEMFGGTDYLQVKTSCVWIKYMEPPQLFDLLDTLHTRNPGIAFDPSHELVEIIVHTISSFTSPSHGQNEFEFAAKLSQLLRLRPLFPRVSLLDQVIGRVLHSSLPVGLDVPSLLSCSTSFTDLMARSTIRWAGRLVYAKSSKPVDIRPYLTEDKVSDSTSTVISGLLYHHPSVWPEVLRWITSESCSKGDIKHLLPIIHGVIDVSSGNEPNVTTVSDVLWKSFLPRIAAVIADEDSLYILRLQSQHVLAALFLTLQAETTEFLDVFAREVQVPSKKTPTPELLALGTWLCGHIGSIAHDFISTLVETGMQWVIRQLSADYERPDLDSVLHALTSLVASAFVSNADLVETLVSVITQYHLSSIPALRLAIASISTCQLKPFVVNRHLQSIIQHPQFFKVCSSRPVDNKIRDALIELLYDLFNLHPHNTCQITHLEPLVRVYRGTLSKCDLRILSIFQLFEGQRKLSITPLVTLWSATPSSTATTALESLQTLDPVVVFRTCFCFPVWRRLVCHEFAQTNQEDVRLYDPVFLMLLFSQMMAVRPPSSAYAWLELFKTNVVSLFIRALSAKDAELRELALCQIVALWRCLESADVQEKGQVQHILNHIRHLIPDPSSERLQHPPRLPTYTTLFLSHAFRAIFYPSNFLYPLTARFLLQRPFLDVSDVPMLYGLFYSSSDENWKKERAWMIKFIADGMTSLQDWKVLKRRHTWDLLASLFQSENEVGGTGLRTNILEVLANLTCNIHATTSLILKSGLLSWIEMQLLCSAHDVALNRHGVEWIKILENILFVVNADRIEAATKGDWTTIISRCLCHLLDVTNLENFPHAVPVVLRLASLNSQKSTIPKLLTLGVESLKKMEMQIRMPSDMLSFHSLPFEGVLPSPPHRSTTLQQRIGILEPMKNLSLWGNLVEKLWHSSMLLDQKSDAWDALTPRILIWRGLKGGLTDSGDLAEWARREHYSSCLKHLCY